MQCRARDGWQHLPVVSGHVGQARFLEDVTHAEVAHAAEGVAAYHAAAVEIPLASLNLIRPVLAPVVA